MEIEKLTIQEEEVMRTIWKQGEGYIKDFLEAYPDPKPPYTTLASVVKNLERKRYVEGKRYGNTYHYTPTITEGDYKRKFMLGFVESYFGSSYRNLVAFFVQTQSLSKDELKEILAMIDEGKNK